MQLEEKSYYRFRTSASRTSSEDMRVLLGRIRAPYNNSNYYGFTKTL